MADPKQPWGTLTSGLRTKAASTLGTKSPVGPLSGARSKPLPVKQARALPPQASPKAVAARSKPRPAKADPRVLKGLARRRISAKTKLVAKPARSTRGK